MHSLTVSILGLLIAGTPPVSPATKRPDDQAVRNTIERSLSFVEKEGVAWLEKRKCSTCHHIPMTLWTQFEARRRGFPARGEVIEKLQKSALTEYLAHEDHQPTGQDRSFPVKGPGPGAVYLTVALQGANSHDDSTAAALKKFTAKFIQQQDAKGGWPTKQNLQPLIDGSDSFSMWVLLTLNPKSTLESERQAWDKGMAWLKSNPQRDEAQWLSLRILLAVKDGDANGMKPLIAKLLEKQRSDGGWSQNEKLSSDAFATGIALYALMKANLPPSGEAIFRAQEFLMSSQKPDGSWLIKTQGTTGHHNIPSFYGTAWATIGLLSTRPTAPD